VMLVRQGVVHGPHDAIAKQAGEEQRGDEPGHAAWGGPTSGAVVELRPVEVEDFDITRVPQQPPGRELGARCHRDAARGEGPVEEVAVGVASYAAREGSDGCAAH